METDLREEIVELHAQICSGLADPSRILILYTLEDRPYSVSELADTLGLSQPTVSRHLKTLRERGMVAAQRDGQSVYYHLADQRLIQALDLLRAVLRDTLLSRADLVRLGRST
jgi:DNA-binding transcriptional ArsR family regulator